MNINKIINDLFGIKTNDFFSDYLIIGGNEYAGQKKEFFHKIGMKETEFMEKLEKNATTTVAEIIKKYGPEMEQYLLCCWNKINSGMRITDIEENTSIRIKTLLCSDPATPVAWKMYQKNYWHRNEVPIEFFNRGVLKNKEEYFYQIYFRSDLWVENLIKLPGHDLDTMLLAEWDPPKPMKIVMLKNTTGESVIAVEEILPGEQDAQYINQIAGTGDLKLKEIK